MKRQSTVNKSNGNGKVDRRRFNKGRIENLKMWPPGVSGNPQGRRLDQRHSDLRELIQRLSEDQLSESEATRLEDMLRAMFKSKSAVDHIAILEHGWGKVPQAFTVEDVTKQDDSELVRELQNIIDSAAETARIGNNGGVETSGSDSGSA